MEVMDTFALFFIYKYEVYQLDTDFIPKQNYVSVIIYVCENLRDEKASYTF